jgi:molybdopterin synthase sulfur carrier subunit
MSHALQATVRVELPANLRVLARLPCEVDLAVSGQITLRAVLDALEEAYPVLRGTVRDQTSKLRRPFIRFFACAEDLSHQSPEDLLPEAVRQGHEPLLIIGAIAGG